MITDVFISYSWWAILLAVALGIFYASVLYYRNPNNKLGRIVTGLLFVIRFAGVSFLAFLLLSPYAKTKTKDAERPIVIIGVDNSASIGLSTNAGYYEDILYQWIMEIRDELSDDASIEVIGFGNDITYNDSLTFDEPVSDYSGFINHIKTNFSQQNVASVYVFGDGIVNAGVDPVTLTSDINWPINVVMLGDTLAHPDINISDIRYNSYAYTSDIFPVEVNISATGLNNTSSRLSILENGKVIESRSIEVNSDNFGITETFSILAEKPGKRRFTINIESIPNETVIQNNNADIFIDILNSRIQILILGAVPHPDIGTIKHSLQKNPNFEVEVDYIDSEVSDIESYDMIILHQVPSRVRQTASLISELSKINTPMLFFTGKQSDFSRFNSLNDGVRILDSDIDDVAFFYRDNDFSKFIFPEELYKQLESLPPLTVPIANYIVSESSDVFAYQIMNGIKTDFPLLLFNTSFEKRNAVFIGEGLWLWRIQSMLSFGNTEAIDALLSKTIMFLTADVDKRRLRVNSKSEYNNYGDVIIEAEYYNPSMEIDNSKEIELSLKDEDSETYNYSFTPYNDGYILNMSKLPVGVYKYYVKVIGEESITETGDFFVSEITLESADLRADHGLLYRLAKQNDGVVYLPDSIDQILEDLKGSDSLRSKIHYQESVIALNSLWPIMIIIILMVSLEWFLRKYFGDY